MHYVEFNLSSRLSPIRSHHPGTTVVRTVCTLLLALTACTISPGSGDPPDNGGNGTPPPSDTLFTVTITSSNPTPQLNEEVLLRCVPSRDLGQGATYSFESADVDLQVNTTAGTATFVVTELELGQSVDVTCSGTDDNGQRISSQPLTLFPTG